MTHAARAFWNIHNLERIAGGRLIGPSPGGAIGGLATDSRAVTPGQAFAAIRGERFDGHDYIAVACDAGAGLVLADQPQHPMVRAAAERTPVLIVERVRTAMGALAAAYRDALGAGDEGDGGGAGALVIGVTGSNGKTSTVRLLEAVFTHAGWRTCASIKSFNNDIGVPLTVLNAPPDTQALICEMGSNNPGEIAALGAIVRPDVAAITSVGRAHLGRFGSVMAVAQEKLSLLRCVGLAGKALEGGGLALVPGLGAEPGVVDRALDEVRSACDRAGVRVCRVRAGEGRGVRYRVIDAGEHGVRFAIEQDEDCGGHCAGECEHTTARGRAPAVFRVPLHGAVMAGNAALAVAIGRWAGLGDRTIASGLERVAGAENRMVVHAWTRADGLALRVLDDCYNASPESMAAALAELDRQAGHGPARVLVLGEMGEMGAHAEAVHREIGRLIVERRIAQRGDTLLCVGEGARWIVEEAKRIDGLGCATLAGTGPALDAALAEALAVAKQRTGRAVVLIKGSRSVGLEGVCPALRRS
jgi:UDP-N-acetylmuramoyl-tripeptide--D-alanyl-D-alanine ligase